MTMPDVWEQNPYTGHWQPVGFGQPVGTPIDAAIAALKTLESDLANVQTADLATNIQLSALHDRLAAAVTALEQAAAQIAQRELAASSSQAGFEQQIAALRTQLAQAGVSPTPAPGTQLPVRAGAAAEAGVSYGATTAIAAGTALVGGILGWVARGGQRRKR